jgi:hypothetical protein
VTGTFCDELPFGFGWIAAQPARLERASHALADERQVWLIDPVDIVGLDERIAALGEPAGVVQLLDRHGRDSARLAARYRVPLWTTPFGGIAGAPFEVVRVIDFPLWREAALWWPQRRTLVVAEALGTVSYYLGPDEALAVHPLLRLFPPTTLGRLEPDHLLCGHGRGIHGAAVEALRGALTTSRRGLPRWMHQRLRRAASSA